MQIATHAIGDRANDEIAALYHSLRAKTVSNSPNATSSGAVRRHRVEHVQHLSGPDTMEALREAGVVAVTNPLHLMSDLDIIEARLGKGRAKPDLAFPSKALLQVRLCCSCQITTLKPKSWQCKVFVLCSLWFPMCLPRSQFATLDTISNCCQQQVSLSAEKEANG